MSESYIKLKDYNSQSTNLCKNKVWRKCPGINSKEICVNENEDWLYYCDNNSSIYCLPNEKLKQCPNNQDKHVCVNKKDDIIKICNH